MEWLVFPVSPHALLWFATISCHFLGDFPWQGEFLAVGKKTSIELLIYHVLTHTGAFIFLLLVPGIVITYAALIILPVSHGIIDYCKIKFWPDLIWFDQILHSLIYIWLLMGGFIATTG